MNPHFLAPPYAEPVLAGGGPLPAGGALLRNADVSTAP